jgi:hypothetical protein
MDLTPVSAPLTKLIEVAARGIGVIYEPVHIVRMAKAHAKAEMILAETDDKLLDIKQRAAKRVVYTEVSRQENIESILEMAAADLPPEVESEPVDQDWSRQFFIGAQDVSKREVQQIWARILAGEVSRPGQFSKRLVEALKTLDTEEAEMFTALVSVSFVSRDGWLFYFIADTTTRTLEQKLGENLEWQQHFVDIGLLADEPKILLAAKAKGAEYAFGGKRFLMDGPESDTDDRGLFSEWIQRRNFTSVGQQLARVVSTSYDFAFVAELSAEFTEKCKVSIRAK